MASERQRKRNEAAQRLGYRNLYDQTKRRAAGELTQADQANRARRAVPPDRFVVPLSGGRWQFHANVTTDAGVRRLQANVEKAARNPRLRITGSATGRVDGKRETQRFGGKSGVTGQYILDLGDGDALAGILELLATIEGAGNGTIETRSRRRPFDEPDEPSEGEKSYPDVDEISLYVFPVTQRRAA